MIPESSILRKYIRAFQKLKQGGTRYGKAPHKPVFLLTIIELIEKRLITENRLLITPELVATFKENFALLVKTVHKDDFTQPFYYLQSEGFWFLKEKPGFQIDTYIRSVQTLNDRLEYAFLADDLFNLLISDAHFQLKQILLDTYFGDTKLAFLHLKNKGRSYLQDLEWDLLNEKEATYTVFSQLKTKKRVSFGVVCLKD